MLSCSKCIAVIVIAVHHLQQAAQRMPKVYRDLFIGRVTRKEESGVITEGVVRESTACDILILVFAAVQVSQCNVDTDIALQVMTYKHLNIKHDPEDDEKYMFDITYIVSPRILGTVNTSKNARCLHAWYVSYCGTWRPYTCGRTWLPYVSCGTSRWCGPLQRIL